MLDELDRRISEIDGVLNTLIEKNGYSYNQYAVLYSLGESPEGCCTQKKISENWYIPKQTVYNICQDLLKKGWIVFTKSETDKREKIITLTEAGRPFAHELYCNAEAFSSEVLKKFGKQRAQRLYELLSSFKEICAQEVEKLPSKEMVLN